MMRMIFIFGFAKKYLQEKKLGRFEKKYRSQNEPKIAQNDQNQRKIKGNLFLIVPILDLFRLVW